MSCRKVEGFFNELLGKRQGHLKTAASAFSRLAADFPAMRFANLPNQGKSKSRSTSPFGMSSQAIERFKNLLALRLGNAGSSIAHFDNRPISRALRKHHDGRVSAIAAGIVEKIAEQAVQQAVVALRNQVFI